MLPIRTLVILNVKLVLENTHIDQIYDIQPKPLHSSIITCRLGTKRIRNLKRLVLQ